MALTTLIAHRRGLITTHGRDRILRVMIALGLPTWDRLMTADLITAALHDTILLRDGQQRLPLPIGIGGVTFVNDVTDEELADAVNAQEHLSFLLSAAPYRKGV